MATYSGMVFILFKAQIIVLFEVARHKDVLVRLYLEVKYGNISWNVTFDVRLSKTGRFRRFNHTFFFRWFIV